MEQFAKSYKLIEHRTNVDTVHTERQPKNKHSPGRRQASPSGKDPSIDQLLDLVKRQLQGKSDEYLDMFIQKKREPSLPGTNVMLDICVAANDDMLKQMANENCEMKTVLRHMGKVVPHYIDIPTNRPMPAIKSLVQKSLTAAGKQFQKESATLRDRGIHDAALTTLCKVLLVEQGKYKNDVQRGHSILKQQQQRTVSMKTERGTVRSNAWNEMVVRVNDVLMRSNQLGECKTRVGPFLQQSVKDHDGHMLRAVDAVLEENMKILRAEVGDAIEKMMIVNLF